MKEKMDYKPFIGKKITKIEEKNNWLHIDCGKNLMSFRLISLEESELLFAIKKITDKMK